MIVLLPLPESYSRPERPLSTIRLASGYSNFLLFRCLSRVSDSKAIYMYKILTSSSCNGLILFPSKLEQPKAIDNPLTKLAAARPFNPQRPTTPLIQSKVNRSNRWWTSLMRGFVASTPFFNDVSNVAAAVFHLSVIAHIWVGGSNQKICLTSWARREGQGGDKSKAIV